MIAFLVLLPVLAVIPGWIAARKGRSFVTYWLFGVLLLVAAVPYTIWGLKPRPSASGSQ